MIGKETIEEKPVHMALVKKILRKRAKDGKDEMIYEQKIALEHAEKFAKLKEKDANQLFNELKELGLRVRDDTIVKLIDVLPENEAAVKAIMLRSGTQLKKDQIQKILDVIAKYKQ